MCGSRPLGLALAGNGLSAGAFLALPGADAFMARRARTKAKGQGGCWCVHTDMSQDGPMEMGTSRLPRARLAQLLVPALTAQLLFCFAPLLFALRPGLRRVASRALGSAVLTCDSLLAPPQHPITPRGRRAGAQGHPAHGRKRHRKLATSTFSATPLSACVWRGYYTPEATNTGPDFNRGSGGGARGCGFEERVERYARAEGCRFLWGRSLCVRVCGH